MLFTLTKHFIFQNVFILVIQTFYIDGNKYFCFSLKGVLNQIDVCHVYENKLFTEYIHLSVL